MSDQTVVQILHPAPVVHRLKGKRLQQTALLGMRTPVALREVDASEAPHALDITLTGTTVSYHSHAGRLWTRMGTVGKGRSARPFGRDDLASLLECRTDDLDTDAAKALFGTPLRGWSMEGAADLPTDLPPRTVDVSCDLRRVAAANVTDFVQDRILIAGDHVLIRAHGPLAIARGDRRDYDYNQFQITHFPACDWHRDARDINLASPAMTLRNFPFRPDQLKGFHKLIHKWAERGVTRERPVLMGGKGLPADAFDDEDLVLVANTLPAVLTQEIAFRLRRGPGRFHRPPEWKVGPVREAFEALRHDVLRGEAALIDVDEAPDVLKRLQAFAGAATEIDGRAMYRAAHLWMRDFVEFRLADRPARRIAPEDADALAALSPSP